MITIKQASSRVRSNRGVSFLTKGADNFDHRGLKKALRLMDEAAIAEQLEDMSPEAEKAHEDNTPDWRFKAVAFIEDGDKWWLDSWEVVGVYATQAEAEAKIASYGRHLDEHHQPFWEMVDVKTDWQAKEHLEFVEWCKERSVWWKEQRAAAAAG